MTETSKLLFAYGTLLSGDSGATGRAQRARLAAGGKLLGTGSTEGRLYSLGRYPGLVLPGEGATVQGEVWELVDAERSLKWLDAYEGIVPGEHPHNEYERCAREVLLANGSTVVAWVYVFRMPVTADARIASGSWLDRD